MDTLVPKFYKDYGLYVNSSRALPNFMDGLKPVERRVLLTTNTTARDKFVKCARVDGNNIGSFHPHATSYGTIVQLVKQGFLDGQGNFGNNIGIESSPAAAERYTECKLSKKTLNMALRLINYVDWKESELDDEPDFLPTMFPFCLLGEKFTEGIGFAFKTLIPCYSLDDLKKRLLFLLGKEKERPIIKPVTNCKILSKDDDLENLLTTGKGSIIFQGIYKISNLKCKVAIKSFPPGRSFQSILGKFQKELSNQDIGWIDESSSDNGGTHIVFEVLKQRNRDEIFKTFIKKLESVLTSTVSFEINVFDSEIKNVKTTSVDEMLVNTFKMYLNVNMRMLKENEIKINLSILEHKLLEKLKKPLIKYLKNKEIIEVDKIVEEISIEINEDKEKIKDLLQKYRITKLLTYKADFNELNEKLETIKNNIKNIGDFVLEQYHGI